MFRLRLRTVLLVVSLFVLVLPVAAVQVLRLYESALLRQTESALQDQAAFVAASYRTAYRQAFANGDGTYGRPLEAPPSAPRETLDLAESPVLPPLPEALPGLAPDAVARRIGAEFGPTLADAGAATRTQVRVVDPAGGVAVTTGADVGLSLAHREEVQAALRGSGVSMLRRTGDVDATPVTALSRSAGIVVVVAEPIAFDGRIVGAVTLWRTPPTILDALSNKWFLLLQAAVLVVAVVFGIASFTARTLVLPIRRLAQDAERLSAGETDTFERRRHYRVREIAELADTVAAMASNLQWRAGYVRDLARHVSHEFKTPITAIQGAVEVLRDHFDNMSAAERTHFLDNVASDVERLDRLTQRLLELARADMAAASDDVTDVLDVARGLRKGAVEVGPGTARARIGRSSAEAVLTHLVDNAVEHGATRVGVRASCDGKTVELRVEDDGEGISEGNRAHVFEPFFTTRRDRGGTGLGLAISSALVRNAGGTIELVASDRGASFRVSLPGASEEAA
ncbi:MAG: HAMP domain-containing histidine kinase [Gammaproteobacteria bacterium]|nr:HAMP domain-containing histidine kinase [Gammaproteobacteria bacterium]